MGTALTQNERLAKHLEEHGSINPLEAWTQLGIYRLGARIWDLKHKQGMNIKTDNVKVKNQFGEDCHVAEYRLVVDNAKMHREAGHA